MADSETNPTTSSASPHTACCASSVTLWTVLEGVDQDLGECVEWLDLHVPDDLKNGRERELLMTAFKAVGEARNSLEESLRKRHGSHGTKLLRAETRRFETTQGYVILSPAPNPYQARKRMRESSQLSHQAPQLSDAATYPDRSGEGRSCGS